MDFNAQSDSRPPRQSPHALPESGFPGMLDASMADAWLHENPQADWNALDDFFFCSSDQTDLQWSQLMGIDSMETSRANQVENITSQHHDAADELVQAEREISEAIYDTPPLQSLSNVPQWLDGAYRPAAPCSHCRRHRLQCLILRTTPANPNPVTSCSSCVALFRECSLAKGEKRLPSRFETFSPVLGHLHGLPENAEYGVGGGQGDSFENESVALGDIGLGLEPTEERKESKQFVRKGARVLREWFYQNQEYPYPSEAQKDHLSRETGFSQKRVSTWFANARRRQKQKIQSSKQTSNSRSRAGSPLVTSTLSSLTPMERWKASPPEDEPVSELAIQDAISLGISNPEIGADPFHFDGSAMDLFNFDETSSHLPSSASSFGSRASETSESVSSAWSHQSGESSMPFPLLPKTSGTRRGRQKLSSKTNSNQYQCTFCTSSFRKRHDWARHEKSVHFQLDSWICTPDLNKLHQLYASSMSACPFCDALYPTPAHWDEHEFYVCAEKSVADRSFGRKDYLWQHLRKFHACTKVPAEGLDAWKGSVSNVQSRCGFCNQSLPTWPSRAEHLAAHFKKGARMEQWQGDWGLNADSMMNLRNAVLPSRRSLMSEST